MKEKPVQKRVALHESVSKKQLDPLAYRSEWELWEVIRKSKASPHEVIWATEDHRAFIHYMEDYLLRKCYLVLRGEGLEELETFIRSKLRTITPEELRSRFAAAQTPADFISAVYLAGIMAAPEEDADLLPVFNACFGHADPPVREAATWAAAYAEWPSLRQPLEHLVQHEPDWQVRETAAAALAGLEKVWSSRQSG